MATKISSIWRDLIKLNNSHIARTCPSQSFVWLRQCAKRINCVVEEVDCSTKLHFRYNILQY